MWWPRCLHLNERASQLCVLHRGHEELWWRRVITQWSLRWSVAGPRQKFFGGPNLSLHSSSFLPFTFSSPPFAFPTFLSLVTNTPLKYSSGFPWKATLVHFSLKIWHLVAPMLLIFFRELTNTCNSFILTLMSEICVCLWEIANYCPPYISTYDAAADDWQTEDLRYRTLYCKHWIAA